MMRLLLTLFLCTLTVAILRAQGGPATIDHAKQIDPDQFFDIDGSPYYFEDWVSARLIRTDSTFVDDVLMNYNGYTGEIEVKVDDKVYEIDKAWYIKAEVRAEENKGVKDDLPDTLYFQHSVNRSLEDGYSVILFRGKNLTLMRDFKVKKIQKEFMEYGARRYIPAFLATTDLYLRRGNVLVPVKQNKKRIAEAFADDKRIDKYIADHHLDVGDDDDLVRLIAYADSW